jgi:hypothetical protein
MQCVNTESVVRRNLINIPHFNSARDFSTAIKSRTARARGNSKPRPLQAQGAPDDKPCTAFECSPTEEPQVCLSGNHRPQRWPTGEEPSVVS